MLNWCFCHRWLSGGIRAKRTGRDQAPTGRRVCLALELFLWRVYASICQTLSMSDIHVVNVPLASVEATMVPHAFRATVYFSRDGVCESVNRHAS